MRAVSSAKQLDFIFFEGCDVIIEAPRHGPTFDLSEEDGKPHWLSLDGRLS
jgi:hypothetical protein